MSGGANKKTHAILMGASREMFTPVRSRRMSEEITLQIQQAILDGHLGSGDQLPSERDLAETLNVSRSALREALRVLEAMGAVTARRGVGSQSGTVVGGSAENPLSTLLLLFVRLRNVPLVDLVEMRETLEMLNARRAASDAGPERASELMCVVRAMEATTDHYSFHTLDTNFHLAVARLSGNTLSPLFMEALRDAMGREMLEAFPRFPDWTAEHRHLVSEHARIAAAIERGDGDAAAAAVQAHIRGFYTRLLEPPAREIGRLPARHPKPTAAGSNTQGRGKTQ